MRLAVALVVLASLLGATPSVAQVYFQYPDARTVEPKRLDAGGYFSGGDKLYRLGGFGRLGIARYWDVGFEALVENVDSDWRGGAGGDLRYQLFPNTDKLPFDLSADAGFGFTSGEGIMTLQAPLGAIISSPLKTDGGTMITPYLGVYAVYVRVKVEVSGVPDSTDSDVDAMLRGGVSVRVKERLSVFGALQLGPSDLVSVGVNYAL